ncbi:hypothetical protein B0H13DRAFT_2008704 [Mycena leptocephala]|nr:hypothetical protein B0H13DRAFT_2008704 [Mycena leptocephala]
MQLQLTTTKEHDTATPGCARHWHTVISQVYPRSSRGNPLSSFLFAKCATSFPRRINSWPRPSSTVTPNIRSRRLEYPTRAGRIAPRLAYCLYSRAAPLSEFRCAYGRPGDTRIASSLSASTSGSRVADVSGARTLTARRPPTAGGVSQCKNSLHL